MQYLFPIVLILPILVSSLHSYIVPYSSNSTDARIRPASVHGVNIVYLRKFLNFKTFWNQIFVLKPPRRNLIYALAKETCKPLHNNNYMTQSEVLASINPNSSYVDYIRYHEWILRGECSKFFIALNRLKAEMDSSVTLHKHE